VNFHVAPVKCRNSSLRAEGDCAVEDNMRQALCFICLYKTHKLLTPDNAAFSESVEEKAKYCVNRLCC
jgi:hypothetical protein